MLVRQKRWIMQLISENRAWPVVSYRTRQMATRSFMLERGFTLIELMIGVVILVLMIGLAMPSYSVWIHNTRVRSATESFLSGLQLARNESVRRNSSVQFVVGAGSAWTVSCQAVTPGCTAADVVAIQSRARNEGSSAAVTVTPVNGAGTTVRFDPFGSMSFPVPSAGSTIAFDLTLATATRNLRVTVATGGTVRMCEPGIVAVADTRHC